MVEITRAEDFGGNQYFLYSGFGTQEWLRFNDQGALVAYDPAAKTERVVISPEGVFTPFLSPCNQTGHIVSTTADYKGPLGVYQGNIIEVTYDPGTCADAGLLRDLYLPYVGLVQRTVQTIAGPRTYDAVYIRVGGVLVATAPETSFTLALDNSSYDPDVTMRARLALRHTNADPLVLTFSTGQEFDVVLRNERGEPVYTWSIGKMFTQMVHQIQVNGEQNWEVLIPLAGLPPGRYTAKAFLSNEWKRSYVSIVGFRIVGAEPAQ